MNSLQVKVKLYLGPLAGELVAELPFTLMHPKVNKNNNTGIYIVHFDHPPPCLFGLRQQGECRGGVGRPPAKFF